jgi:heme/copper-type cytochrome/quinol oxidase subunit 2
MVTCVSEGSYNVLFIMALAICITMILISAYFYDRFSKMERGVTSEQSIRNAKNMAMIALIVIIISIAVLFLIFFGFQKRMVGVSVTAPASSMKFVGPEQVSFGGPSMGGYPTDYPM